MTQQVIIHCKPDYLLKLRETGLTYFETNNDEVDVIVDDVPYQVHGGYYQDPDEQLCEHYGIDYDQVNCIEAM